MFLRGAEQYFLHDQQGLGHTEDAEKCENIDKDYFEQDLHL